MKKIKVMVINAQDLYLFMDKFSHDKTPVTELSEIKWQLMSSSLFSNKSKEKCQILARTILESDADVVMMTEVGGEESLSNFSKHLLGDAFFPLTLPSNSDRGIDLGYLVRKDLPFELNLHTYVNYSLSAKGKKFSRDVLRLDVLQDHLPKLIFLLVHIKSKLDLKRLDFEGRDQRMLEIQGLVEIYLSLQKKFPEVPILVGGDLNGHAGETDTEEEFKKIYAQTDLKDIAYLTNLPPEERFSYIYFNKKGDRFQQQIDYLFLSEKFQHLLDPLGCYFSRYKNLQGLPLPIPQKLEQKDLLPSDHYPFVACLSFPLTDDP